ncbi:serine hydrolase domain-containing protein, partial [Rubrivirga sp.]|uniref:serine hydrolase domain-containing protein n=1 Tax=Rubrivirga sp. TaxID=1885344 RepID=UPI003C73362C
LEADRLGRFFSRPVLARLALIALLSTASAAQPPDRATRLDSALTAAHADGLFSGALVITAADGDVMYRFAAGDLEGDPVTTDTPLYVASVTKAMTAAAALSLAADGRLDLDAPVADVLEGWPYAVTARQLMDQTAGLHFLTMLTAERDTTRPVTTADLLALVAQHAPGLVHEPGTAFDYDNANYATLAAVLETASGTPYADVLRERVFEPAEMTTAFVAPSGELGWAAWSGGDGDGVWTSAEDLARFDDAFWNGRIIDLGVVDALTPPALEGGALSTYAAGRFSTDTPRPLIGAFGDGGVTKAGLWRELESRKAGEVNGAQPGTTYAMIATDDGVYRTPVLTAAMAIWNGEPFALPLPRLTTDVPDRVLERHVGVYESGMGRLHITLEDGQLHLEPEGAGGSEPLIAGSETVFYFCCQDLTWEFVLDEAGRTVGLQIEGQPQTLGTRVE